jgi:hypothetical protein
MQDNGMFILILSLTAGNFPVPEEIYPGNPIQKKSNALFFPTHYKSTICKTNFSFLLV